jgi:uncharacterized protein YgbK (DUF1537 family)
MHLQEQSPGEIELLDILALTGSHPGGAFDVAVSRSPSAILFDGLDDRSELATGRLLWERRAECPFVVGSSGLTHALMQHWREIGILPERSSAKGAAAVDRIIVMSGSCSRVTEMQIEDALSGDFEGLYGTDADHERLLKQGLEVLSRGSSLVVYSARGSHGVLPILSGMDIGSKFGKLLRDLIAHSGVRRVVIAGGDTSSHAFSQLGIYALTFAAVMSPGAPLCLAHSDDKVMDGLELVLKGGQVGGPNFFTKVLKGSI